MSAGGHRHDTGTLGFPTSLNVPMLPNGDQSMSGNANLYPRQQEIVDPETGATKAFGLSGHSEGGDTGPPPGGEEGSLTK